jgi:hypothetical protein
VEGTEIEISTGVGGGDCGYDFKNGQRYLVYAYRYQERLTTNICSRTKPFSNANEDLAFLGNLSSAPVGVTIQGRVLRDLGGKPDTKAIDPDVSITIEGEIDTKKIRLDEQGRYRFSGLPSGKYKLTLQVPDTLMADRPEREVTVANRGCAVVDYYVVDNGKVRGRIFDAEGQPVSNIIVALVKPETPDPTTYVKSIRTDEQGNYSFSAVPQGRYIIAINFNRFPDPKDPTNAYPRVFYPGVIEQVHAEIITVELGAKVLEYDVRLPPKRPSSVLDGLVVWTDGTPVSNASVGVKDVTHNESALGFGVQADQHGRFKMDGHIGQKLLIEAESFDGAPRSRSERMQITLEQPVQVVKIVIPKPR